MDKHPEIFDKHVEGDLSLIIFFMFERLKGDKSKWHIHFEIQSRGDLPAFWDDEA